VINSLDPFDVISEGDIRIAIGNSNGLRASLFVPEIAFENLVK
jgi:dynamin 1-like protein